MGDYTRNGTKIGTCGSAYYSTLGALKNHPDSSIPGTDAKAYVDPKNNCNFAFPFPEYDGKGVGEISNFHQGSRVEFTFKFPKGRGHHKDLVFHTHPRGAEGLNVFTPCPYDPNAKRSRVYDNEFEVYRLTTQHYYNGKLHVGGECAYCGCINIFDKEEAQIISNIIMEEVAELMDRSENEYYCESDRENYKKEAEYKKEIAKRIIDTYK